MPFPLPEAVEGRSSNWSIQQSNRDQGSTDIKGRSMLVPTGDNLSHLDVRTHELGHVVWSPEDSPKAISDQIGVPAEIINAVEDARINLNIGRRGIIWQGEKDLTNIANFLRQPETTPEQALTLLVSATASNINTRFLNNLVENRFGPKPIQKAKNITDILSKELGIIPFEKTIEASRYMYRLLNGEKSPKLEPLKGKDKAPGEGDEKDNNSSGAVRPSDEELSASDSDTDSESNESKTLSSLKPKPKPTYPVKKPEVKYEPIEAKVPPSTYSLPAYLLDPPIPKEYNHAWGEMVVEEPPMTRTKFVRVESSHILFDEGLEIHDVARLYTDQRLFGRPMRFKKGSVLIDASGSMHWEDSQLQLVLNKLPYATVAMYSSSNDSLHRGTLRLLAKRGRMVDARYVRVYGGGNVVDGPALQWLARQEQPRIWISDGLVTGVGDSPYQNLVTEAYTIVKNSRIRRIDSIQDL